MRAGSVVQAGAAIGAALVGALAVWVAFGPGRLPDAIPHATAGFVVIACGAVASIRVRWSRTGPLLVLLGLAWFAQDFAACLNLEPLAHRCLDPGPVGALAGALEWAWVAVLIHVVLAFPDGRLADTRRRAVAAAVYGIVIGCSVADVAPAPAGLAEARVALPAGVALAALAALAALLAVDEGRADLTPDRAVGLGEALAAALGDPRFRIAFPEPAGPGLVDAAGHAVPTPVEAAGRALTPVARDGRTLALVEHDPATLADPQIRSSVLLAVELAAHNSRLRAELDAQLGEVAASRRRLVNAALDERRELAAQVEIEVLEPLGGLAARLDGMSRDGQPTGRAPVELDVAREEIRSLASGLYPGLLGSKGLAAALRDLATRSVVPVEVRAADDVAAGPDADATIYFVCAETLANAARYARASRVALTVLRTDDRITAVIQDDGVGGADLDAGSGLRGLRDRVEALGGTLEIASAADIGTRLTATIPVGREARPI